MASSFPNTHPHFPPLYALIIGINSYTHPDFPDLKCAHKDADDFEACLTSTLAVPPSHIINLRNQAATRTAILDAFDRLKNLTTSSSADQGVGIIVYFTGHGTRGEKPMEWADDGITLTAGNYYEALCPSDMGKIHTRQKEVVERAGGGLVKRVIEEECEVPAIPDRTIATLINRFSETSGNNITLIFDCCFSAGASRSPSPDSEPLSEGYVPRFIPNPPPLPHDYDHHIVSSFSRTGGGIAKGLFSGKNSSSHVLLAACGREQYAYEHPSKPNSVFTYALLKVLNEVNAQSLTYTSLMHRLNMPRWQNAHCEGVEVNRRLFNHRVAGGDPSFILGTRLKDGSLVLDAGAIQGITIGCAVSVHESNLLPIPQQPNPPLETLVVVAVEPTFATLSLPSSSPNTKPLSLRRTFYCKVKQRPSESLVISSNDIPWLKSVFSAEFCALHSVTIVSDIKAADLVFTRNDDSIVYIDHNLPLVAAHIGTRSPHTISSTDISLLQRVVSSVIAFRSHLLRVNPTNERAKKIKVKMEFYELEMGYGDDYELVGKPVGMDLFEEDPAVVVVEEEKRYGVKTINLTDDFSLYPHLFYFDPSELSIIPWYLPPLGAGASLTTTSTSTTLSSSSHLKTDIILPPQSSFCIGYGPGGSGGSGVDPWEFMLVNGCKKDVGFFKLFVTTVPVNLGSVVQESPYDYDGGGGTRSGKDSMVTNKPDSEEVLKEEFSSMGYWDVVVKGVVQVES